MARDDFGQRYYSFPKGCSWLVLMALDFNPDENSKSKTKPATIHSGMIAVDHAGPLQNPDSAQAR